MNEIKIDVCICTYDRASIVPTLSSIARQQVPAGCRLRVVIADNNVVPLLRSATERFAGEAGLPLVYVHVPAKNIALARNACLDLAAAEWIAFIDDDEVAAPDWLAGMLAAADRHDVVFGCVQAVYPDPSTPAWLAEGDFHSTRLTSRDPADKGFTGNVLMRRSSIVRNGARFDLRLGQLGGEDTLFFRDLHRRGARFAYVPDALVYEDAAGERASLSWLIRRRYRMGQLHLRLAGAEGRRRVWTKAVPKAAVCVLFSAVAMPSFRRAVAMLLRGAFHLGVVGAGLGARQVREYG